MIRKLGKNIIACVGLYCINFKKLKKMNIMIPEIYEKIWEEKNKWGVDIVVYANASDYKLIQILYNYSNLYTFGGCFYNSEYKNICKEVIKREICQYRGVNNDKLYYEEPQQNMYIFIQQKIYDQNIFQIEDILEEKRIKPNAEFIIDVDKRRPDDQRLWALVLPWDFENLMKCMIKKLDVKGIRDVGGFFREDLRDLLNSSNVVPDLKEKSRVDELGYILFERRTISG
jgi:hypothetical protein